MCLRTILMIDVSKEESTPNLYNPNIILVDCLKYDQIIQYIIFRFTSY